MTLSFIGTEEVKKLKKELVAKIFELENDFLMGMQQACRAIFSSYPNNRVTLKFKKFNFEGLGAWEVQSKSPIRRVNMLTYLMAREELLNFESLMYMPDRITQFKGFYLNENLPYVEINFKDNLIEIHLIPVLKIGYDGKKREFFQPEFKFYYCAFIPNNPHYCIINNRFDQGGLRKGHDGMMDLINSKLRNLRETTYFLNLLKTKLVNDN